MPRPGSTRFRWSHVAFFCGACASESARQALPAESTRPAESGVREALRKTVQASFPYDPSVREKMLAVKELTGDATLLEAVVVLESTATRGVHFALEHQRRQADAEKPSLAHGAAKSGAGWKAGVISYQEMMPFGTPVPRWTLFKRAW